MNCVWRMRRSPRIHFFPGGCKKGRGDPNCNSLRYCAACICAGHTAWAFAFACSRYSIGSIVDCTAGCARRTLEIWEPMKVLGNVMQWETNLFLLEPSKCNQMITRVFKKMKTRHRINRAISISQCKRTNYIEFSYSTWLDSTRFNSARCH